MKKIMLFALLVGSVSCAVNASAQNKTKVDSRPIRNTMAVSAASAAAAPAAKNEINASEKKEVKKAPAKNKKESKPATK